MIAITGGSGEIASRLAELLLAQEMSVILYGRSANPNVKLAGVYRQIINYDSISLNSDIDSIVITNGAFRLASLTELTHEEIDELVEANFTNIVKIIQTFLTQTRADVRRNIFVLGSTSVYDLSPKTSLYSASKLALKGLIQVLNKEFAETDTRFSYISFSTVDNKMGRNVPDQINETLLSLDNIVKEIIYRIINKENYFEPEVIIRRRSIQEHKK
jgi:NADP-dependent 3-hydroxy acid dehydrogenase YdfG